MIAERTGDDLRGRPLPSPSAGACTTVFDDHHPYGPERHLGMAD